MFKLCELSFATEIFFRAEIYVNLVKKRQPYLKIMKSRRFE